MRRRTRLLLVAAAILFVSRSIPAAAENGGILTFTTENDRYAIPPTDRHYTNGLRLSWLSPPTRGIPEAVTRFTDWPSLLFLGREWVPKSRRWAVIAGHSIFTPKDTEATGLVANDRPYAGWFYFGASLNTVREDATTGEATQDTVELDLGIVGPYAGGEEVQNTWHDIIGVERARGWDNQIHTEPGAMVTFERKWRTGSVDLPFGLEVDAIPSVTFTGGNVLTAAAAGATVRIGDSLATDFGPPRIRPSLPGYESFERTGGFGWYLFAGAEGRAVAHNIFLDGNTFRSSHSVDRNVLVGDFQLGLTVFIGRARISLTHVIRTEEFAGQPQPDRFGSISVSWQF